MSQSLLSISFFILMMPFSAFAEKVYIIDRIEVGMHTNAKLSSPILKIIATGTELEMQQRGVDMSKVKDNEGTIGWVNTAYLVEQTPGSTNTNNQKVLELQSALNRSQTEIKQLKKDLSNINNIQESKQLKSMKLKVAELEAELSKAKTSKNTTNPQQVSADLEALTQKNLELEEIISKLKDQPEQNPLLSSNQLSNSSNLLWIILFAVLLGIVFGILIFDFYKRHQHGGFRV